MQNKLQEVQKPYGQCVGEVISGKLEQQERSPPVPPPRPILSKFRFWLNMADSNSVSRQFSSK